MKTMARAMALVGVLALTVGACGERPESAGGGSSGGAQAANSDFQACMVTDSGGIDDRSFNAVTWNGLKQAEKKLGIKTSYLESQSNSDYQSNINQFVQQDCNVIVTVGFLLADATLKAAKQNPDQKFVIADYSYPKGKAPDNVKGLVFNTAEAGFLAGYLAAGMTESGKVATFGGQKIPTVTIFMDGYWAGVQHYNKKHGTNVKVLGWNKKSQQGVFTGDFTDQSKGKQVTEQFIRQGADIIHPVAGPVGLGAAAAAKDAKGVELIWVDTDGCNSAPQYCSLFLTSVVKGLDTAAFTAVKSVVKGTWDTDPYVGTLKNNGVRLAPYHKYADEVPTKLKQQIKKLEQAIISGKVEVKSPAAPDV